MLCKNAKMPFFKWSQWNSEIPLAASPNFCFEVIGIGLE
jgi:hypothetical protein